MERTLCPEFTKLFEWRSSSAACKFVIPFIFKLLFLERYEGLKDKETQDITAEEGCFIDLESRVPFTKRC